MCVSMTVIGIRLGFSSGRPRILCHCIFQFKSCFLDELGANYCNNFYDCSRFGTLGEAFDYRGEFSLFVLIVVRLGHGVEYYRWPVIVVTVL